MIKTDLKLYTNDISHDPPENYNNKKYNIYSPVYHIVSCISFDIKYKFTYKCIYEICIDRNKEGVCHKCSFDVQVCQAYGCM